MKNLNTPYGKLCVGGNEEIFDKAVALIEEHCRENDVVEPKIALSGGSTPRAFYRYCVEKKRFPEDLVKSACWFTSDERMVPMESDESNFGNAARLLLDPLDVPDDHRFPWGTAADAIQAAHLFNDYWVNHFSPYGCFDVCFLGMGDDCHTASIFPHSPLLKTKSEDFFAAVEVPDRGWRLSTTPRGLEKCGRIVVIVCGESKAVPLSMAFDELCDPDQRPIQMLEKYADRVWWLVDTEAAAKLADLQTP